MSTLKGSKLKMFHYFMDVVSLQTTNIKNLETLVAEEKENYVLLEKRVDVEEARNDKLCKIGQTTNDLNDSLYKDLELLTLSFKAKEDELIALKKSHEALKFAHIKTIT